MIMEAMRSRWTDHRIDDLKEHFDSGFAAVDKRFDRVDERFDRVERRFEERFDKVDKRFEAFERRFDLFFAAMLTGFAGLIVSNLIS